MSDRPEAGDGPALDPADGGQQITPLAGEAGIPNVAQRSRAPLPTKGLLAVGLVVVLLIAVSTLVIQRYMAGNRKADDESRQVSDRPAAASTDPRRLDMTVAAVPASAPPQAPRIPALVPTPDEVAEPIGVRRTGTNGPAGGGAKPVSPEDAPAVLVSSRPGAPRPSEPAADGVGSSTAASPVTEPGDPLQATTRNLLGYQRQLQGLLDTLTRSTTAVAKASGSPTGGLPSFGALASSVTPPSGTLSQGSGLIGGQLQGSATPRVVASTLGNRSLTLPKGTAFTCALKTKVISATSGFVGCQVQRNVFSDDGRVLLVERGSHLDGEYRVTSVKPGTVRIPVLWTRIRTPNGVTVDVDSPGTGPLGESGIEGYVDNRWIERIGAAMLLSLIDDSVKLVIQSQANDTAADTLVLPSTTSSSSKLAEKVLDSTINIPPLIYQNQGGVVGIYVARDVDFSAVYELKPVGRDAARGEPR